MRFSRDLLVFTALFAAVLGLTAPVLRAAPLTEFTLPPLNAAQIQPSSPAFGRLQVGVHRSLAALRVAAATLPWAVEHNRAVTQLRFVSEPATALRLGLQVDALPDGAVLRFFGATPVAAFTVTGSEINRLIRLNQAADGDSPTAREYWSPVIAGTVLTVEIALPLKESPAAVALTATTVAHLDFDPHTAAPTLKVGEAARCNLDVNCYGDPWDEIADAVARMIFVEGGRSYLCSGTLLEDGDDTSKVPYFLSAAHCFQTQTAASSLSTFWFYRSTACNSGRLSSGAVQLDGGAQLLHAAFPLDTLFVELNRTPPVGTTFAQWSLELPTRSDSLVGIHHPQGDLQKISFGGFDRLQRCNIDAQSINYTCADVNNPDNATHLNVIFGGGTTEGGSSGSGIWVTNAAGQQPRLVGQLSGGTSSCNNPRGDNQYGRFDRAYEDALNRWLAPMSPQSGEIVGVRNLSASNESRRDKAHTACTIVRGGSARLAVYAEAVTAGLDPMLSIRELQADGTWLDRDFNDDWITLSEAERDELVAQVGRLPTGELDAALLINGRNERAYCMDSVPHPRSGPASGQVNLQINNLSGETAGQLGNVSSDASATAPQIACTITGNQAATLVVLAESTQVDANLVLRDANTGRGLAQNADWGTLSGAEQTQLRQATGREPARATDAALVFSAPANRAYCAFAEGSNSASGAINLQINVLAP